ncbi:MAG: F0F1 ATP synthase subunit A [Rhodospirillaceae bacterium]|nr:F0F1 ATP synthase subunit A [Rhodospirillaceae bacterium]
MSINVLEQFKIQPIIPIHVGGVDISFSNSALYMVATVVVSTVFLSAAMSKRALIPGRMQSLAEMVYEFIAGMLKENVGDAGRKYFPLIFSLFMFVLCGNVLGQTPYSFTYTSHIIVTAALALGVITMVTIVGFATHGIGFLHTFLPGGAPPLAAIIIVPIEVFSYFARAFSLSVRLAANMLVGHIMLAVVASFISALGFLGIIPFAGIVGLGVLELGISCLQAYIFTVLSCIYLHDALHLH